jgi:hypothetical protein
MVRVWALGVVMLVVASCSTVAAAPPVAAKASAPAPYVGASEADNEFHRITAADMEIIRSKHVLFGSRSSGLCLREGLARLAAQNRMYALPIGPTYDLAGKERKEIPDDAPKSTAMIHYLFTLGNADERAKEFAGLVERFDSQLDAAMLDLQVIGSELTGSRSGAGRAPIDRLTDAVDLLSQDHPKVRFIYSTCRLVPDPESKTNEKSWELGQAIARKYRGQAPVFDWLSLLSTHADGTSAGHMTCLEFNKNNDKMHPNADFAKERLGRAYLVMMYKLFCSPGLAANAGFDRTVTAEGGAGMAKAVLDGSASVDNKDPARRLARYVWREGDKVLAESDQPTAEVSLPVGVHTVTLTVTSSATPPETSTDEVRISVAQPSAPATEPAKPGR